MHANVVCEIELCMVASCGDCRLHGRFSSKNFWSLDRLLSVADCAGVQKCSQVITSHSTAPRWWRSHCPVQKSRSHLGVGYRLPTLFSEATAMSRTDAARQRSTSAESSAHDHLCCFEALMLRHKTPQRTSSPVQLALSASGAASPSPSEGGTGSRCSATDRAGVATQAAERCLRNHTDFTILFPARANTMSDVCDLLEQGGLLGVFWLLAFLKHFHPDLGAEVKGRGQDRNTVGSNALR